MPRKKDWAEEQTDNLLEDLESRIKREYDTASKEVQKKYDKFVKDFEADDSKMLKSLEEGKISEEAYKKWRAEQMLLNRRWQAMRDTLADDLTMVDKKVLSMTNGYMPEAYSMNFNFATFEVEKGSHVDTSFTLYSRETVEKLMRDDPQLLPKRKMDIPKDKLWNKQHINSAITQGVLQGDSLPQISKRLRQVTDMDARAALRNARTMMTGAQNAGRLDAYTRAENLGITVLKEWMATLDHHTRESHAKLDGEKVKLSEKFSNGLMFPGDSKGEPHEVYNCRCTMVADVPEYPDDDMKRYDNINGKPIDNVTYAEWAGWKKEESVWKKMSEEEYKEWQKLNSTQVRLTQEANRLFEEKYGITIKEAQRMDYSKQRELGLEDYVYDEYGDRRHRWIDDIIDEDYLYFQKDLLQVCFGHGHIGYVQCADGSKMINSYLRNGESKEVFRQFHPLVKRTKSWIAKQNGWIENDEKQVKETISSMKRLIDSTTINENIIVDRWAGINSLEFMGLNIDHGMSYRIGHAFVSDGIDYSSVSDSLKKIIGSKITDNGFMSTSGNSDLNIFRGSDVKFSIKVPAGTKAFITDNVDESEIVFAPGTVQEIEGINIIETEAVDYEGKKTKRTAIEIVLKIIQK